MKASTLLEAAATRLEEKGWMRLGTDEPQFTLGTEKCAGLALCAVAGLGGVRTSPNEAETEFLRAVTYLTSEAGIPNRLGAVYEWNDRQSDPAAVINALRFASKRAREAELLAEESA